ncbi:uncharacterized protein LOC127838352 isoform X3 [Dreissena polymorpha]|uniref:uncharacterized protein LOC127838352 isoform X3 n=1 Tax=Dreissena polymorpha TaxID=45954 RepID=UPI0022649B7B|nr:uncharacterized protein LOC127838352 isoform X3 [Dreissena polymorpha]
MGILIYLLMHMYIVASTNVTSFEWSFVSNKYEFFCFWLEHQNSSVMLFSSKNESRSVFYESVKWDENRCYIKPAYLPYGMKCRCIDQGFAGCKVTATEDSTSAVEWKCAFRFNKALQYSNVSENVIQADHISSETVKGILETKHTVIYTRENKPVSLHCSNGISAYKMPEMQNVTWYAMYDRDNPQSIGGEIKINHTLESVINVSFTRSEHGLIVYCAHGARIIAQWTIFVFYPPTVVEKYIEITESATIRQECNFFPGNPKTTKIRWRKGNLFYPHHKLELTHISRQDAGNYTCEATNRFDQGGIVYVGNDTGTLRLIVLYPTNVARFYINDMFEEEQVTLVETGNGTIHCYGDGNPAPTLSLMRYFADNQSDVTLYTVNSTYLRYDISTLDSQHSGKYTCATSNRYGETFRTLHLIIKQLQVQNKTCYVCYKNSEETEWNNVIANISRKETHNSWMLDLKLINLRSDTQYEIQLIASLPTGNYSIAPSLTVRTLSFSKTTGIDIIIALIVCSVLIICISLLLRVFMKRPLRVETLGDINNIRMGALTALNTTNEAGSAPGFILFEDEDHYDCIEMSRTDPGNNSQDDLCAHNASVPPDIVGRTHSRDGICLQTQTANKVDYEFLDRTGNPAEGEYKSIEEDVEDSDSWNTDSTISDTCLQYLTVIENLPIPPERINAFPDMGLSTSSTACQEEISIGLNV